LTNTTKWIIAVPFAIIISVAIPGLIARNLFWFADTWAGIMYVVFSGGMWLVATAFVDLSRPRSDPDLANRLIPIGLILSVPISVWDHLYGIGTRLPSVANLLGFALSIIAIFLGISSWRILGRAYSPRPGHSDHSELVQAGPYRLIRHPMYLAAFIWVLGWPLLIVSVMGSFIAIVFVLPSIIIRIKAEERELEECFGAEYGDYKTKTWRLIPYVY
jgi:protein-S-isoprenylcysteine O-methyltransferase Ste14